MLGGEFVVIVVICFQILTFAVAATVGVVYECIQASL